MVEEEVTWGLLGLGSVSGSFLFLKETEEDLEECLVSGAIATSNNTNRIFLPKYIN